MICCNYSIILCKAQYFIKVGVIKMEPAKLFSVLSASNGWIVQVYDNGNIDKSIVFEEKADNECSDKEVAAFADLLRWILENYGPSGKDFTKHNIYVDIRPGDEFDTDTYVT